MQHPFAFLTKDDIESFSMSLHDNTQIPSLEDWMVKFNDLRFLKIPYEARFLQFINQT